MPIYEFLCNKCGNAFEELTSGDARVSCPSCGAQDAQRLMSACVRHQRGGNGQAPTAPASSGGGCGGCSGGNCSACGH